MLIKISPPLRSKILLIKISPPLRSWKLLCTTLFSCSMAEDILFMNGKILHNSGDQFQKILNIAYQRYD